MNDIAGADMTTSSAIHQSDSVLANYANSRNEIKPKNIKTEITSEVDDQDTKPPKPTLFGLPKDAFQFRDKKSNRMYTVVQNGRYYQVVYDDGEWGARAPISDDFSNEPQKMKDLWEACGPIIKLEASSKHQDGPRIRNVEFYY